MAGLGVCCLPWTLDDMTVDDGLARRFRSGLLRKLADSACAWLASWIGKVVPPPSNTEVAFFSLATIGCAIALSTIGLARGTFGDALLGRDLGGDFIAFYVAGKTMNEFPSENVYDVELQRELRYALLPKTAKGKALPFAYPPFVAALFRPFARIPYIVAYPLWMLVSLMLYAAGLRLACLSRFEAAERKAATLAALSFWPFLFECWVGG